ncbi:hypothetical protein N7532_003820 [Penicillium argentinense]|uniref:Uncharacterized protein n=1 Tax=Penicillium argentinense TaxID=1131581 RepID=A0A9W9KEW4_9EURO|nr:uncharacterized protein N7532_003820 [Penicillium argentinense]KAJ5103291.1 hypothetical protein N7532_003820 [Penicillium argentinense]
MPDEPRRIIIEKSSTVRRRYQRSNKVKKFTAAELKRMEREEELSRRAKAIREKEKKRIANKKKREEQERERKRLGLPDPNAAKIPASQPLLSNFLGLARKPPLAPEPAPDSPQDKIDTDTDTENLAGDTEADTEADSEGPDASNAELEKDLSEFQEASIPQEHTGEDNNNDTTKNTGSIDGFDEGLEKDLSSIQKEPILQAAIVNGIKDDGGSDMDLFDDLDKELENDSPCLKRATALQETTVNDAENDDGGDTDQFDDWDEELQNDLYCLQDAGIPDKDIVGGTANGTSNVPLAQDNDRDDDEFSDCSAFDDANLIQAADTVTASSFAQNDRQKNHLHSPSKPAAALHPPSSICPKPTAPPLLSTGSSFYDDTADYLEEVFARGTGDPFSELF